MTVQKFNAPIAPGTLLVSAMSDIIAPFANAFASTLISLAQRITRRPEDSPVKPAAIPAPHVAMVMVPGNFVTQPFLRR